MKKILKSRFLWGFCAGAIVSPLAIYALLLGVLTMRQDQIAENLDPPVLPTVQADYDWTIHDLNGEATKFSEFQGQTVFLTVFRPGCAVCKAELPFLDALYQEVKDDNIAFVALSTENDPDRLIELVADNELTLPIYTYEGDRPDMYVTGTVPSTFVIAPDGTLVFRSRGAARYDDASFVDYLRGLTYQNQTPTPKETGDTSG